MDLFVRGVWVTIPETSDLSWVDRVAAQPGDDGPCGDYGPLVQRMLDAGVAPYDIARLARISSYQTAHGFCYHLADPYPAHEGLDDPEPKYMWHVMPFDPETGEQIPDLGPLTWAHEVLLGADPDGREMRPAPPGGSAAGD